MSFHSCSFFELCPQRFSLYSSLSFMLSPPPSPSQPPEVERAKDPDVFSPPIRLSLKLHACTASPACRRSSGGAASVTPPPLEVEVAPPQHLRLHRRVWSSVANPFKVTARWTWICYRDDWLLPRWFGWSSFKPEDLRSLLLYYI